MPDYRKDLAALKIPGNIKEAECASSPYVLRKVFAGDPLIKRLIRSRTEVVPLIEQIIAKEADKLPEISLAAYTYILEQVDQSAATRILKPLYQSRLQKPGPFFMNFAAHLFRIALGLPTHPLEMVYTKAELAETVQKLK